MRQIIIKSFFLAIFFCVLMQNTLLSKDGGNKIQIPCQSFTVGSNWVYSVSSSANQSSNLKEEIVTTNENNKIQIESVTKYHNTPGVSGMKAVINYILINGNIFIESIISEMAMIKSKNTYIHPKPFCGNMPFEWIDSIETEAGISEQTTKNISTSKCTLKFIGKEHVNVKAGSFNVFVYEFTNEITPDKSGSKLTIITTTYIADNIGIVKSVSVSITKVRKVQQAKYTKEENEKIQSELNEGIEDMKKGKNPSETAFGQDTSIIKPTVYEEGFDIRKNIITSELVSYKIN